MKRFPATSCLLFLASPLIAANFSNLDFERWIPSEPIPGDPYNRYPASRAIPRWTPGTQNASDIPVLINERGLNAAGVSVYTLVGYPAGSIPPASVVLQGERSAYLQAGVELPDGPLVSSSLWQSGTVPDGMQSLEFLVGADHSAFTVSINGVLGQVTQLGEPTEPTRNPAIRYALDLQGMAGREIELKFTVGFDPGEVVGGMVLDELSFSPNQVPEPEMIALIGVGVGFLGLVLSRGRNGNSTEPHSLKRGRP